VLANEDESRLFYVFPIVNNDNNIMRLRWMIRNVVYYTMNQFHFPIYYENPIFHVSVASSQMAAKGDDYQNHGYDYNCIHDTKENGNSLGRNDNSSNSEEEENESCCSSESSESEQCDIPIIITKINFTFGGGPNKKSFYTCM